MARFRYQREHIDFLREKYPLMTFEELTEAFNAEFGLQRELKQIKYAIKNYSIKCGRKVGSSKLRAYTQEHLQFLREYYPSMDRHQLTKAFNKKFGTNKTDVQIIGTCKNHGIKSGRTGHFDANHVPHNKGMKGWQPGGRSVETQFKKGRESVNKKPIGSERVNVDGYVEVKTAEPNVWTLKQRIIYEREIGPLKPDHNIRFKDGNKQNFELSNLMQVSNSVSMYMTLNGYSEAPDEVKDTVVAISKLQSKTHQLTSNR
ncbi:HNH endonuclease [Pseudoalteromonas sp. MMG024]|uniref:HNH endonuclease n=1 Tax=Pseudoalteromonas sp. MMG024 TaxID=2909980 RepID=UPI0031BB74E9|nr:HNH endonuclease [Pseudoalteromonas sp. MMG024]